MSQGSKPLIYCQNWSGHRRAYGELLGTILGGTAATAEDVDPQVLREPRPVLFATIDDHIALYAQTAIRRAARGLTTSGIFLRPHSCFGGTPVARAKRLLFALLRRVPGVTTIGIVPFDIEPRFAHVCNEAIHDPQFWDAAPGRPAAETCLSNDIRQLAGGRPIIAALGALATHKGTAFLAEVLEAEPALTEAFFWVCAGPVSSREKDLGPRLRSAGAYLVDRFLDDEELASVYAAANLIWACYAPAYDQASGVFGRALQYRKTPIVRHGATIERFGREYGFACLSVNYDADHAARSLLRWASAPPLPAFAGTEADHAATIERWRERSVDVLRRAIRRRA